MPLTFIASPSVVIYTTVHGGVLVSRSFHSCCLQRTLALLLLTFPHDMETILQRGCSAASQNPSTSNAAPAVGDSGLSAAGLLRSNTVGEVLPSLEQGRTVRQIIHCIHQFQGSALVGRKSDAIDSAVDQLHGTLLHVFASTHSTWQQQTGSRSRRILAGELTVVWDATTLPEELTKKLIEASFQSESLNCMVATTVARFHEKASTPGAGAEIEEIFSSMMLHHDSTMADQELVTPLRDQLIDVLKLDSRKHEVVCSSLESSPTLGITVSPMSSLSVRSSFIRAVPQVATDLDNASGAPPAQAAQAAPELSHRSMWNADGETSILGETGEAMTAAETAGSETYLLCIKGRNIFEPGEEKSEPDDPFLRIKVQNHHGVYVSIFESAPKYADSNPDWDPLKLHIQSAEKIIGLEIANHHREYPVGKALTHFKV